MSDISSLDFKVGDRVRVTVENTFPLMGALGTVRNITNFGDDYHPWPIDVAWDDLSPNDSCPVAPDEIEKVTE